ncbi:LIC12162 family protein [Rhodospirillales bacterium]|nr:LIC12162 family protein [Rhodospirillales bacterium]
MINRLFLGPVDENFDFQMDVAAGPWCFIGRETTHPGWEDLDFVEPFDTPDKLVDADRMAAALVDTLAGNWAERLNTLHKIDRPVAFWYRYLLLWLSLGTTALWARWRNFEELVRRHGQKSLTVYVATDLGRREFADLTDFMQSLNFDPIVQFEIDSMIARSLAPPDWNLVESTSPLVHRTSPSAPIRGDETGSPVAVRMQKIIPRLPFDHLPGIRVAKLPLSLFVAMLPRSRVELPDYRPSADKLADFSADFLALLDSVLTNMVPDTIGGANFCELDRVASSIRYFPGRLYIANTRSVIDRQRLIVAHALIAGERLVSIQHGGWDGTGGTIPWSRPTYAPDHAHLTWGWECQADLPVRGIPYLAPALAAFRNQHRQIRRELIFVGARIAVHGMRFDCVPRPREVIAYRKQKVRFFKELNPEIMSDTIYRPKPQGLSDLEDEAYVLRHIPDLPILAGDLNARMTSCRLVVLDHPGTALHFALAANIPVVCFWNWPDWALCKEAQPYFEALHEAGVLYTDAEAAAEHINSTWEDIPRWWSSRPVQGAVVAWRQRYARTGPFARLRLFFTVWKLNRLEDYNAAASASLA